ncbi:MAG: FtsW/RodA/SpoVE family cell cycle protein [Oscillospiraceae bacterium]|nr:FtsW/RodA/SpoVE family cell cycle protein [Oscillospiraceae bacterium]
MNQFLSELKSFPKKGDWVLLLLALITSAFGCVVIASATSADKFGSNARYIIIQLVATLLGVLMYAVMSSIDIEVMSEYRSVLVLFNCILLLLLITPLGTDNDTGNRSWLKTPIINIQPAEICKITYIVIMASVMNSHQNRISHVSSVIHMVLHLGLLFGLNMIVSKDAGVSLIFAFIFIGMAFAGGVSLLWFGLAIGGIAAAFPILWQFLGTHQKNRILILFDPTIDPLGINERFHSKMNLLSLTGGGLTGQGLFEGNRTQAGALFAQHTDYVFSSIGEELGFFGCVLVMLLEFAIIARCIYVGIRSQDYIRRLVCFGAASALIFQVMVNVGMCIGVMPVIGLTLPLISYGGSSIVTIYAMLGLVSGSYARPESQSHERYIQPHRAYRL